MEQLAFCRILELMRMLTSGCDVLSGAERWRGVSETAFFVRTLLQLHSVDVVSG